MNPGNATAMPPTPRSCATFFLDFLTSAVKQARAIRAIAQARNRVRRRLVTLYLGRFTANVWAARVKRQKNDQLNALLWNYYK
jgi:hypothetical protein